MSSYFLEPEGLMPVKVTRKKGMRSLRIRISPKGEVLVSTPWNFPNKLVQGFVEERKDWILKNTRSTQKVLEDGAVIGLGTKLIISDGRTRNRSSVTSKGLEIGLAGRFNPSDNVQQRYIEKKVIEAMATEAENVLLPRLDELASKTGYNFNQAFIKRLSSRWGSCDQYNNIILNVFLIQLPAELQDYVMLHELTHTKHMNHSPDFWQALEEYAPGYKVYRKLIKNYRPRIEVKSELLQ